MTDHEPYEILCTLAATGQLAGPGKVNFDQHCLSCPACRDQVKDLISIGAQLQLDAAFHATSASMPAGSLERFRARAIRAGIVPHSAPARSSPSYALASAATVFVIVAALVFMSHGREAADSFAISAAAPIPGRQGPSAFITRRTDMTRPAKAIRVRFVRHSLLRHTVPARNDASLIAQRFPQPVTASYPFYGMLSTTKSSINSYPTLSPSQISRFDLFRNLGDFGNRSAAGMATHDRPIDIASTGNIFDFAANIRQLHFQLPTAQ